MRDLREADGRAVRCRRAMSAEKTVRTSLSALAAVSIASPFGLPPRIRCRAAELSPAMPWTIAAARARSPAARKPSASASLQPPLARARRRRSPAARTARLRPSAGTSAGSAPAPRRRAAAAGSWRRSRRGSKARAAWSPRSAASHAVINGAKKRQVGVPRARRQPRQRPVRPALLDGLRHQQQPRLGGQLRRRDLARRGRARGPSARCRSLRSAPAARTATWPGSRVGKRRKQLRRARMLAVDRGRPRLDVGQRGIAGGEPRRGRRPERESAPRTPRRQELTCSGNWGLRRLRE